jgi:hypothetical protein
MRHPRILNRAAQPCEAEIFEEGTMRPPDQQVDPARAVELSPDAWVCYSLRRLPRRDLYPLERNSVRQTVCYKTRHDASCRSLDGNREEISARSQGFRTFNPCSAQPQPSGSLPSTTHQARGAPGVHVAGGGVDDHLGVHGWGCRGNFDRFRLRGPACDASESPSVHILRSAVSLSTHQRPEECPGRQPFRQSRINVTPKVGLVPRRAPPELQDVTLAQEGGA